jgi:hypothetical protein
MYIRNYNLYKYNDINTCAAMICQFPQNDV